MKLTVTERGLYLKDGEASVGDVIEVEGDAIPALYLGKVRPADQQLEVATPKRGRPKKEE